MWVRATLRRYRAVSVIGAKNRPRCLKSAVPFENKLCVCISGMDAHGDGPPLASVWLGRNVRFDKGTNRKRIVHERTFSCWGNDEPKQTVFT